MSMETYKSLMMLFLKTPMAIVTIVFSLFNVVNLLNRSSRNIRNDIFIIFHSICYIFLSTYGFAYSNLVMGIPVYINTPVCAINFLIYESLLTFLAVSISLMSIDRALAATKPMTYYREDTRSLIKVLFIAILASIIINIPLSFFIGAKEVKELNRHICTSNGNSLLKSPHLITGKYIVNFVVPVIITMVCYIIIYREGKTSLKKMNISSRYSSTDISCQLEANLQCIQNVAAGEALSTKEHKFVYLCVLHASSFPLLFLPFTVYLLIVHKDGDNDHHVCHVLTALTDAYTALMAIMYTFTHEYLHGKLKIKLRILKR